MFEREKRGAGKKGSERWGEKMPSMEKSWMAAEVAGRMALKAGRMERRRVGRIERRREWMTRIVRAAARGAAAAALAAGRESAALSVVPGVQGGRKCALEFERQGPLVLSS